MADTKFGVMVQKEGEAPKIALVGSGATVRSALRARKIDPESVSGKVTLNGRDTDLNARLKTNDLVAVTPNVAGGSR